MPYIKRKDRELMANQLPRNPGELTYVLYRAAMAYLDSHGKKFQTIAEIIGSLECAKLEFYRRVAAPYEDGKIAENGDV